MSELPIENRNLAHRFSQVTGYPDLLDHDYIFSVASAFAAILGTIFCYFTCFKYSLQQAKD